jgi:hypothetical protein
MRYWEASHQSRPMQVPKLKKPQGTRNYRKVSPMCCFLSETQQQNWFAVILAGLQTVKRLGNWLLLARGKDQAQVRQAMTARDLTDK